MADEMRPVAGMRIYIGGVKATQAADFVAGDFAGESWTEIDNWQTMGQIGDGVNEIVEALINRGRDISLKGTANSPPQTHVFLRDADDPGQQALIAAGLPSNKNNYAFRIQGNETTGYSSPSFIYFVGMVMGTPEPGGNANTARRLSVNIKSNSNYVYVDPVV